jgi:Kef-type K+ transport system membrane component KefB
LKGGIICLFAGGGEVALILAAMGLESGLLPTQYYTAMIIVITLTTLVTPPLLKMFFGTRNEQVDRSLSM